jgi:glycosyltransferase involved in cell wall biosynthesis
MSAESPLSSLRVVLGHDWLTGMRGGERVLLELCRMFPQAPILTLLYNEGSVSSEIVEHPLTTSALQELPFAHRHYRRYLPLMPALVSAMSVPDCDLLITSSHCAIKALRPPRGARHLCYVHTPMRYAWDLAEDYFGPGRAGPLTRLAARVTLPALRRWDFATCGRVDSFVANSAFVRERVARLYRRESGVVHPPIELDRFQPGAARSADGPYLMVTAFAPYKRVDVAIAAFRQLGRRLLVVGSGQEERRLRPLFGGSVEWLGPLPDAQVAELYRTCRAFVMPGPEDFGLTPLEAQASGRPVIALARGGALETVVPLGALEVGTPHPVLSPGRGEGIGALASGGGEEMGPTGILYALEADEVAALIKAVLLFEANEQRFTPEACRANAERFSPAAFREGMTREIRRLLTR